MAKPHAATLIPGPTHEFLLIETRQAILPSHCALHNRPRLFFVYNLNSNISFLGRLFFQFKRLVSFSINKTIRLEADRSISFLFVLCADPDCKTFSRLVYFVSVSRHLLISFMGAWTACKDFWVSWPSIVWPGGDCRSWMDGSCHLQRINVVLEPSAPSIFARTLQPRSGGNVSVTNQSVTNDSIRCDR